MQDENDKDISIEEEDLDDSVVAEENAQDAVKKLRMRLKESEAKAKEYLDGWQRDKADFLNLRKRDEEARQEFVKFAKEGLLEDLLPVLDSFQLALAHPSTDSGQAATGSELIYKQLIQILKRNGLEEFDPRGEMFDPRQHEAVGTVESSEEDDNKILEVVQKGYILSGKIIRPAKVKIGQNNG